MFFTKKPQKRIYLDYAAATPLHKEVLASMLPFLENSFGNPSAIHAEGQKNRNAVEAARQSVATTLGIRPNGVIFTSGGTESNNIATLGYINNLHKKGTPYQDMEVLTTKLEHPSISEIIPVLEKLGVLVKYLDVNKEGKIQIQSLEQNLISKTVLVTFAYANSEVGVVQSVSRLARVIKKYEKENHTNIALHIDAAQAPLWLSCKLEALGVDMMSLDVGKCGGPKGLGILAKREGVEVSSVVFGGGQEGGVRPGTENVASIVGAAKALELAQKDFVKRVEQVGKVRDEFFALMDSYLKNVFINGALGEDRLANNINISLIGFDTEYAVVYLDKNGVAASTKSACAGAGSGESAVVLTMTGDKERAKSTLRLTLGEDSTTSDMKTVLEILKKYQEKMAGQSKVS
jgi:cysteine desulfurase